MVLLFHINVSFAARSNIELRTVSTMNLGRVFYNQFFNGVSKQTNEEDNTKEGSSALTFIKGTIEKEKAL